MDFKVHIFMGRPFFAICRRLLYMDIGEMRFGLNDEVVKFNICHSMKITRDISVESVLEIVKIRRYRNFY